LSLRVLMSVKNPLPLVVLPDFVTYQQVPHLRASLLCAGRD
jgi:hypothetical protein